MQFAAFIDEALNEHREYWRRQLADGPREYSVPPDFARPAKTLPAPETVSIKVTGESFERISWVCRGNKPLLFTMLLAGLEICVSRYAGVEDVQIGTTIRLNDSEIARYNKIIVLREKVHAHLSFREFTLKVKETVAAGYQHAIYPLSSILKLLNCETTPGRCPLFNVAMLLEGFNDSSHLAELSADVVCVWSQEPGALTCRIHYHPELMARSTINTFAGHYIALLRDAVSNPQKQLKQLNFFHEGERKLIGEWNQTTVRYPRACVHELFEEQAARTPDATALVSGRRKLTYAELNSRANQVAHYLIKMGIGPEVPVGICLERNIEMVVAILGVLKSGGVYLPLDPAHPAEKLSYMMEDAGIRIVLTQKELLGENSEEGKSEILDQSRENPPFRSRQENLAYILYTSGSTGRPKGVAIQHSSLLNYIWWACQVYGGRQNLLDFPLYSSISFDLTVTSIFTPLVSGGCIHIYGSFEERETLIERVIREDKVGTVKLTPSHLSMLNSIANTNIRQLILGGEALETSLVRRAVEQAGAPITIWNEYGPTEATVGCMLYQYQVDEFRPYVPIGKPAANTQIHILNEEMEPAPIGIEGEIYIGGCGLARGYINRPELTAERFLPDPFSATGGGRLYRTGDRARYLPEGNIEYLGRRDEQVKFHGHRIELGEIRTALNQFTGLRDTVVRLEKDDHGHALLVAYYAADQEQDPQTLRAFLQDRLIREMVPGFFVHLKEIPLTVNGKVNYAALPSLKEIQKKNAASLKFVAARTPIEEMLAGIWSDVLGLDHVGVEDNFFQLGGHSLMATQVMSRVRSVFQVELPLRALFDAPTVAGLARRIEAIRSSDMKMAPQIARVSRRDPIPLSYAQQRLWFLQQLDPQSAAYNVPLALRFSGALNKDALCQSFAGIVARHEVLRTRFVERAGVAVQEILPDLSLEFSEVDLSELHPLRREAETRRLLEEEASMPFDLQQGRLLRVRLLRCGELENVLLVTMHHIVADAWSVGLMVTEFCRFYDAYIKDEHPGLPELKVQYADFSVWQRRWLQGELLEAQLRYWRQQLAGAPDLELPTDWPRSRSTYQRCDSESFELGQETSEKMNALCHREGVTLFMLLLAAYQVVLGRYTGQQDIVVGSDIANRNRLELEGLIGFFVNQLVLRTDLSGDGSFRELLQRVRQTVLEGYEHQDVPFERLVDELASKREIQKTPLFQAKLVLQNTPQLDAALPGLMISSMDGGKTPPKYDTWLNIAETSTGIQGTNHYNADLFAPATIRGILHFYKAMLSVLAEDSEILDAPRSKLLSKVEQKAYAMLGGSMTPAAFPVFRGEGRFVRGAAQSSSAM